MPHPKRQVKLICEQCGIEFSIRKSLSVGRRFCNWKCRLEYAETQKGAAVCPECNNKFETYIKNPQIYCSIGCGVSARNKTRANPSKHRDISGKNNPMYGKGHLIEGKNNPMYGRNGKDSPAWSGGKTIRKDGYILVYAPDHPFGISKGNNSPKYILEHRLVMEKCIGRYLKPEEVVHHIDGNPSNNSIDNLELYSSQSEHIKKGHGGE